MSILKDIFYSNIRHLVNVFKDDTQDVFYDSITKKVIHPGEMGSYRESAIRDFLKNFLPECYGIGDGFIVAPNGYVSRQCDVIIYYKDITPIIKTPERQRFFPIESVLGVIEVKSTLDNTQAKSALSLLQDIKKERSHLNNPAVAFQRPHQGKYQPLSFLGDQIGTFIFANKATVKNDSLVTIINEADHFLLRPNHICCVSDYITNWYNSENRPWMYPSENDCSKGLDIEFEISNDDSFEHVAVFFRYLLLIIGRTTFLYPELTNYFGGFKSMKKLKEDS